MFLELVQNLLLYERDLVFNARVEGHNILRPSTVIITAVSLLYAFSGIDLLPERYLGFPFGYLDDLAVIIGGAIYVFADLTDIDITGLRVNNPFKNLRRRNSNNPTPSIPESSESEVSDLDENSQDILQSLGTPYIKEGE